MVRFLPIYRGEERDDDDDDDEDEDEVYCDIDNDPNVIRKVFELEGQEMDDDDEDQSEAGDNEAGASLALKPTGWSDGRDEEVRTF